MRYLFFLLPCLALSAVLQSQNAADFHRTVDGKPVDLYWLENAAGMRVAITNYGGRIVSLVVPDRKGRPTDVVAGYATLEDYLKSNEVYFGALIGRYANRIANGQFSLDGKTYNLAQNNGPNALHGGPRGFHNQVWDAVLLDPRTLLLEYVSPDGEEGYPGTLRVQVTYSLEPHRNELRIEYRAVTDKPTVVNLTNHAFFNLTGEGTETINDHVLQINSTHFSPVDKSLIPTSLAARSAYFDFSQPRVIGAALGLPSKQLKLGKGYDHNFVLRDYHPGVLTPAATAFSPKSGISLELSTTQPGVQFYGGNFLAGKDRGKSARTYEYRSLFCLEPQHFPNSPNDRNAPSTTLRPGDQYVQVSTYLFRNNTTWRPVPLAGSPEGGTDEAVESLSESDPAQSDLPARWTEQKARNWQRQQPWRVGANYIPAYAINQLEMWQTETFDTVAIERELRLAAGIGMNTMRIFLHDLLWRQDPVGYKKKIDTVLRICDRNGITPMLVFFDSVWNGEARLGKQPDPTPGVHNSGWVKSPNLRDMATPDLENELLAYVYDVVNTFRNDARVYAWDVWNEPDNTDDRRATHGMSSRNDVVAYLLPKVFAAARAANPLQPLTSGVWWGWDDWADNAKLTPVRRIQLEESDVISFHCYADSAAFEFCVSQLSGYQRPLVCTEYLARSMGSTFEKILPIGKKHNVAMVNWGLVQGKTQTHFPWDSWQEPYTKRPLAIWHHEVFQTDGKPYREAETQLIRTLTKQ